MGGKGILYPLNEIWYPVNGSYWFGVEFGDPNRWFGSEATVIDASFVSSFKQTRFVGSPPPPPPPPLPPPLLWRIPSGFT